MASLSRGRYKATIILAAISTFLLVTYSFSPRLLYNRTEGNYPSSSLKWKVCGSISQDESRLTKATLKDIPTSTPQSTPQPTSEPSSEPSSQPASQPASRPTVQLEPDISAGPRIKYKNDTLRPLAARPFVPTNETFPAAASARSPSYLPSVPRWNTPPKKHAKEVTPIFIGFTRNWPLLQQTVVSLITAGWPPSDIYVVENTGVMDANRKGQLSLDNPFFLDHHRLTHIFQVNVLVTPSLQTFAQLQNFYLFHAITNNWPHYFWAHMDIIIQSLEDETPYQSFYSKALNALRRAKKPWAVRFFAYDWVTCMNTNVMVELGGWDSMISYYGIDCDMYDRMRMRNYSVDNEDCGPIYDTGESLEDLKVLYREGDELNSTTFHELQASFKAMTRRKNNPDLGARNRWQVAQTGGQGEPWYRDLDGFAEAIEIQVQAGLEVYRAKWHAQSCELMGAGLKAEDEWLVESIDDH